MQYTLDYTDPMARQGSFRTLSAHFYEHMRRDIVLGEFAPGERLAPAHLSERYQTSTTVIREALLRLTSERLVTNRPGRGFSVISMTPEELNDLTRVRAHNDAFGLGVAIERGDLEWETRVMTAHHVLVRTPRRDAADPGRTRMEWTDHHRAFHLELLSGCGIPVLIDLASALFDATELFRRLAAPSTEATSRDVEAEHRAISEAALARDAPRAAQLLTEHYFRTMDVMYSGLQHLSRPEQ